MELEKMIEKVNIENLIVVAALSGALYMSINNGMSELSTAIVSGLLGYIGGSAVGSIHKGGRAE